MGLRSVFANRKLQKPMQFDDPVEEERAREEERRAQAMPPAPNTPAIPGRMTDEERKLNTPDEIPRSYSQEYGHTQLGGFGAGQQQIPQERGATFGLTEEPQNDGDASRVRYGSNQDNKWMANTPAASPVEQPQQPAIAQAVAKRRGFNLEPVQDMFNSYRMHTGDIANQMRTAISGMGQAVPGVKPLGALDHTAGVKNEVALQQAVETKKRQRLQDQLAYMKQLEEEQQQNEWAAMSLKNGGVMYNKRTGDYRPMVEFNDTPDMADLKHEKAKATDSEGNTRDYHYWVGNNKAYVTGADGTLQEVNLNELPWELKNEQTLLELKQAEAERKSKASQMNSWVPMNVTKDIAVAFPNQAAATKAADLHTATLTVTDAYKAVTSDKQFTALTTPGKSPEENAKKVVDYNMWARSNATVFQPFYDAQAKLLNTGVMNTGEYLRFVAGTSGLPPELFENPDAYAIDGKSKDDLDIIKSRFFADARSGVLTQANLVKIQAQITEIARRYPDLIDPSAPRKAMQNITKNTVRATKRRLQTTGINEVPDGSRYKNVYDSAIDDYYDSLLAFPEEPATGGNFATPPIGVVGQPPVAQPQAPRAAATKPAQPQKKAKSLQDTLNARKAKKAGGAPTATPAPTQKSGNTSWKAFKGG